MEVPTAEALQEIYPTGDLLRQGERWNSLLSSFEKQYGHSAEFVARSPGRVNIIGEHIDYSMYQVLPMAILCDVLMAVAVTNGNGAFKIANVEIERFSPREFSANDSGDITIAEGTKDWSNYFKAALQGVKGSLNDAGVTDPLVGMEVLVDGNVPPGGGLSSSAAMMCAGALAVMKANKQSPINKTKLCELAIVSERAVGVNSGGMDQAASIFSTKGSATYVSFLPKLEAEAIKFPQTDPPFVFMVAQSLVEADKHVSGPVCYNLRVVEVTLAAEVLARIFGLKKSLPKDKSPLGASLRGFHDTYFEEKEGIEDNSRTNIPDFSEQLSKLETMVGDYLPQEEGYTREQISNILGLSVDELNEKYMSKFPVRAERFKLRQRALHVFTEAARVLKFRKLLAEPSADGSTLIKDLGGIMNETQDSCRDVYECSCPELDELCRLAQGAGAAGSRLTGAGWGGSSVHLVPKSRVQHVIEAWTDQYYKKKWPDMDGAKLKEAIVVSEPGSGAFLYSVSDGKLE